MNSITLMNLLENFKKFNIDDEILTESYLLWIYKRIINCDEKYFENSDDSEIDCWSIVCGDFEHGCCKCMFMVSTFVDDSGNVYLTRGKQVCGLRSKKQAIEFCKWVKQNPDKWIEDMMNYKKYKNNCK